MPPLDPSALLCEGCGYHLEGLPRNANCPECASPIAESLPAGRVGSPWQQRPSFLSWVRTAGQAFLRPRRFWERVQVTPSNRTGILLHVNLLLASVFFGLPVLAVPVLLLLTLIEYIGIWSFGKAHERRITPQVAFTIVAHASYGWLFGAGAGLLISVIAYNLMYFDLLWAFPVIALLALLWFEALVYLGVRDMRFANPPGAGRMPRRDMVLPASDEAQPAALPKPNQQKPRASD